MADTQTMPRVTVFISYSRADKDFADQLAAALEDFDTANVKVLIDRRDLPYGEKWWDMLIDFIQRCDRVLFLVSPDSIKSGWCEKELSEIARAGRRLVPIVVRETPIGDLPEAIKSIQLLPFTPPTRFETQIAKLVVALYHNAEWNRHRRVIDTLSDHWAEQLRPKSLLLGAEQVERFKIWMAQRPMVEPPLSEASAAFMDHSGFHAGREQHYMELRSLRADDDAGSTRWATLIGGCVIALVGFGYLVEMTVVSLYLKIASWVVVFAATAGAGIPLGQGIHKENLAAAGRVSDKEGFLKRYNALEEAEAFIGAQIKQEADAEQRRRDAEELKRLQVAMREADKAAMKRTADKKSDASAMAGSAQSSAQARTTVAVAVPVAVAAVPAETASVPAPERTADAASEENAPT